MADRLTDLQRRVLTVLARFDHLHVISVANRAHTTRSQAQRALNTLADRGLVNRYPTRADHHTLSPAGRAVLESSNG